MDPASLIALLAAVIPFATAGVKKLLGTDKIQDPQLQAGLHTLLPLVLGMLSSAAYAYAHGQNLVAAIAAGLAAGGVSSSVRDVDKNLIGIAEAVTLIYTDKRTSADPPAGGGPKSGGGDGAGTP